MVVTPHPIAEGRPMSFRSINIYHRSEQKATPMIEITTTDNRVLINGHAGYAPAGYDIVCAGITALTDTLWMSLETFTNDIESVREDSGLMDIKLKSLSKAGALLVGSFVIGVTAIAGEYPDNVQVRDDRPRREA